VTAPRFRAPSSEARLVERGPRVLVRAWLRWPSPFYTVGDCLTYGAEEAARMGHPDALVLVSDVEHVVGREGGAHGREILIIDEGDAA
jgi:hypothetical protein